MDILREYLQKFKEFDGEKEFGEFATYEFLSKNLPIFTCSDKAIEETYYFRAYNFAKHIKKNGAGEYIVTEFSIPVHWAKDTEGAIACPVGHQLRELRWLKNAGEIARSYISFWLEHIDRLLYYNNWFISALYDYLCVRGDWEFAYSKADKLVEYFERQKAEHLASCGMYKSVDNYDGMELSISSYGIRPTINAYIYGNALALSKILGRFGDGRAKWYRNFAEDLRGQINERLFQKDFYYALPLEEGETDEKYLPRFSNPNPAWGVKEQMGYVPFYFGIPEREHCIAFQYLTDEKTFSSKYGITTADKSHPQFGYYFGHSCLWNGPVWPFATSQTLTGVASYLQKYDGLCIDENDYVRMLRTYALSQRLEEEGVSRPFIDENLDGETGEWLARKWIRAMEAEAYPEGRGFDYNHSTFVDLVISGLCGAQAGGRVAFKPLTGSEIERFALLGVELDGVVYDLFYARDEGLQITKK